LGSSSRARSKRAGVGGVGELHVAFPGLFGPAPPAGGGVDLGERLPDLGGLGVQPRRLLGLGDGLGPERFVGEMGRVRLLGLLRQRPGLVQKLFRLGAEGQYRQPQQHQPNPCAHPPRLLAPSLQEAH